MQPPLASPNLDRAAAWSWRLLVSAAAVAAILALLWYLRVIVLPVAVALTIAPAVSPVASWFRRRRFLERPAAALALLMALALGTVLVAIVAVSVIEQFDELVASVRRAVDDLAAQLEREPFNLSVEETEDLRSRSKSRGERRPATPPRACRPVPGSSPASCSPSRCSTSSSGTARRSDLILQRFSPELRPAIDRAGGRAWDVLGGFVRGTAQVATIDAVLIGIGLWLLDVPLAFALAVLVFMGSFVPYVGAFVSGLVAVLVAFADGGWELALAVLALVLLVQFVEGTFLQPLIQSRSVHLHPAIVLLAVAAGGSLFGIAGAYLAVPVTAVVAAVFGSLSSEAPEPDSAA